MTTSIYDDEAPLKCSQRPSFGAVQRGGWLHIINQQDGLKTLWVDPCTAAEDTEETINSFGNAVFLPPDLS